VREPVDANGPEEFGGDPCEGAPGRGSGRSDSGGRRGGRRRAAPPPEDSTGLGPDADPEAVARKILLDQLTGQARSRAELATKLAKRRVPEEVAQRLLDRFEEVGLVDDAAFARLWVESRQPGKGLGRRALAQELRRKGVDEEVARAALDEVEPEDEEAAARELVRRKLRTMRNVDRTTATRRLSGMLARKGHGGDVVWRVVREELDARGYDDSEDGADVHGDDRSP
jgi:regulatory protein